MSAERIPLIFSSRSPRDMKRIAALAKGGAL